MIDNIDKLQDELKKLTKNMAENLNVFIFMVDNNLNIDKNSGFAGVGCPGCAINHILKSALEHPELFKHNNEESATIN